VTSVSRSSARAASDTLRGARRNERVILELFILNSSFHEVVEHTRELAGDPGSDGAVTGRGAASRASSTSGRRPGRLWSHPGGPSGRGHWVNRTSSIKAVLSPPALSRPAKVIVCAPAVTVNAAVVKPA